MAGIGFLASNVDALSLYLELGEPKKRDEEKGGGWEVETTAIVSQGNRPEAGIAVQFYLDDKSYEDAEETEGDGRIQKTIVIKKPGKHKISAGFSGTTKTVSKRVTIKDDDAAKKVKGVYRLTHVKVRSDDHYTITFQTLSQEGEGVKDVIIRIMDAAHEGGFYDLEKTGANGAVTTTVAATDQRDGITAMALGTGVQLWIHVPKILKGSD